MDFNKFTPYSDCNNIGVQKYEKIRLEIESTIHLFLSHPELNLFELLPILESEMADRELAWKLLTMIPIAFVHIFFRGYKFSFSEKYGMANPELGTIIDYNNNENDIYNISIYIAVEKTRIVDAINIFYPVYSQSAEWQLIKDYIRSGDTSVLYFGSPAIVDLERP